MKTIEVDMEGGQKRFPPIPVSVCLGAGWRCRDGNEADDSHRHIGSSGPLRG